MPMNDDDLRVMLHERAATVPEAPERLVDLHHRCPCAAWTMWNAV